MLPKDIAPGVTMKFPLSVKMDTVKKNVEECSVNTGPLALTLVRGKLTSAIRINHVPYAPGGVNYVETTGDVISGIFSGCVMAIYTHNGNRRVGHVHTGDDAGANLDCKDFMKALLASPGYHAVFQFKPFEKARDGDRAVAIASKTAFGANGCCTFGLVTAANECYSLYTRKVSGFEYVIEAVEDRTTAAYVFA